MKTGKTLARHLQDVSRETSTTSSSTRRRRSAAQHRTLLLHTHTYTYTTRSYTPAAELAIHWTHQTNCIVPFLCANGGLKIQQRESNTSHVNHAKIWAPIRCSKDQYAWEDGKARDDRDRRDDTRSKGNILASVGSDYGRKWRKLVLTWKIFTRRWTSTANPL